MKLMTKEVAAKLPLLYSQEQNPDPIVQVKFFNPSGSGSWYVLEYDGDDTLFTYVVGMGEDELGYSSLAELQNYKGRFGLGIERDLWFKPVPLSKIKSGEVR